MRGAGGAAVHAECVCAAVRGARERAAQRERPAVASGEPGRSAPVNREAPGSRAGWRAGVQRSAGLSAVGALPRPGFRTPDPHPHPSPTASAPVPFPIFGWPVARCSQVIPGRLRHAERKAAAPAISSALILPLSLHASLARADTALALRASPQPSPCGRRDPRRGPPVLPLRAEQPRQVATVAISLVLSLSPAQGSPRRRGQGGLQERWGWGRVGRSSPVTAGAMGVALGSRRGRGCDKEPRVQTRAKWAPVLAGETDCVFPVAQVGRCPVESVETSASGAGSRER